MENPFTPSFGTSPPLLVGRAPIIESVGFALSDGVGSPGRATLISGVRGTGKTVTLNEIEHQARDAGWVVAALTARPGMVDELVATTLPGLLRDVDPEATSSTVTGVNASVAGVGAGVTREQVVRHPVAPSLRSQVTDLTTLAEQAGGGLLLSIDEVNRRAAADLSEVLQTVQHGFRENRQVAIVAAGLPSDVQVLLQEPGTTFLRRAERHHLGPITPDEAREGLHEPIQVAGRTIDPEALDHAVAATRGYPFMVQLVGRHTWQVDPDKDRITLDHAQIGSQDAARRVGQLVHEPALAPLPTRQRQFLDAMAVDSGPSRIADVAERVGIDRNSANQYRQRLIDAELIHPAGHGLVDYSLPYMREHLRDPGASSGAPVGQASGWDTIPTPEVRTGRSSPLLDRARDNLEAAQRARTQQADEAPRAASRRENREHENYRDPRHEGPGPSLR